MAADKDPSKQNNPRGNPVLQTGVVLNPAGRAKGSKNKDTLLIETAEAIAAKYKLTPLDYLMSIVNDEDVSRTARIDAAKAAAPYVHKRMPQVIEATGKDGQPMEFSVYATARDRLFDKLKGKTPDA